jgi:pimeloyl-ACP methyl ester carboxylesterase
MAARNEAAPEPRRMQYRIGINLGDVIHDESRIYGDGINVAARLEGIAEPGGICISRQVFEHVNRAVKADFQALGLRSLKNIAQPVDVFAIVPRRGARPGEADRTVDDISFDAFVGDLEAVADAAQVPRFVLFGVSQGCAVAVAYAVRHPERVSHLVLYGGYALGVNRRSRTAAQKDEDAAMLTLMRLGWGKENPAFRQLFTSQFMPGATKEQADWFNELQRVSVSPEIAARITETNGETDVTALLPRVSVPTLVMHARDDARVPFDAGRRLAAGIPGARFVPLQGRNHLFLETEPAFGQFLEHTRAFLAG